MINYHPDYPQYSEAKHDNFLTDKQWIEGFALLGNYQMSFEMCILRPLNLSTLFTVRATPFHSEIGLSHSEICVRLSQNTRFGGTEHV